MSDARAENLIRNVGIDRPGDIDLDAIASMHGIIVKYQPLNDCEAMVVGIGDKAVVKINSRSMPERQRFSLGHEIGHWIYHKGRILYCAQSDIDERDANRARESEKVADNFSASLLMPSFLFRPIIAKHRRITWQAIKETAREFRCSPLASALRVVDLNIAPLMFVMLRGGKRVFFRASKDVSEKWFPLSEADPDSFAFDLSFDAAAKPLGPRKVSASSWFDRWNADRFDIIEDSVVSGEFVYALLSLEGEHFCA